LYPQALLGVGCLSRLARGLALKSLAAGIILGNAAQLQPPFYAERPVSLFFNV
jgi:hypothetical protein